MDMNDIFDWLDANDPLNSGSFDSISGRNDFCWPNLDDSADTSTTDETNVPQTHIALEKNQNADQLFALPSEDLSGSYGLSSETWGILSFDHDTTHHDTLQSEATESTYFSSPPLVDGSAAGSTSIQRETSDCVPSTFGLTSSQRKARSRNWPMRSDHRPRYTSLAAVSHIGQRSIGSGGNSGRNFLALFGADLTARTFCEIVIERGRPQKFCDGYPKSDRPLPAGLSLEDICNRYPLHVWGSGLRLFMAEGWTGEQIFNALPENARHNSAAQRKWNYLQQAMGREADKMMEEEGHPVRVPEKKCGQKRKRAVEDGHNSLRFSTSQMGASAVNPCDVSASTGVSQPGMGQRLHHAIAETQLSIPPITTVSPLTSAVVRDGLEPCPSTGSGMQHQQPEGPKEAALMLSVKNIQNEIVHQFKLQTQTAFEISKIRLHKEDLTDQTGSQIRASLKQHRWRIYQSITKRQGFSISPMANELDIFRQVAAKRYPEPQFKEPVAAREQCMRREVKARQILLYVLKQFTRHLETVYSKISWQSGSITEPRQEQSSTDPTEIQLADNQIVKATENSISTPAVKTTSAANIMPRQFDGSAGQVEHLNQDHSLGHTCSSPKNAVKVVALSDHDGTRHDVETQQHSSKVYSNAPTSPRTEQRQQRSYIAMLRVQIEGYEEQEGLPNTSKDMSDIEVLETGGRLMYEDKKWIMLHASSYRPGR